MLGFLVSWFPVFLVFLVSWFLGFLVSKVSWFPRFPGFQGFQGFFVSWFPGFPGFRQVSRVSSFLGFQGFLVSLFPGFEGFLIPVRCFLGILMLRVSWFPGLCLSWRHGLWLSFVCWCLGFLKSRFPGVLDCWFPGSMVSGCACILDTPSFRISWTLEFLVASFPRTQESWGLCSLGPGVFVPWCWNFLVPWFAAQKLLGFQIQNSRPPPPPSPSPAAPTRPPAPRSPPFPTCSCAGVAGH